MPNLDPVTILPYPTQHFLNIYWWVYHRITVSVDRRTRSSDGFMKLPKVSSRIPQYKIEIVSSNKETWTLVIYGEPVMKEVEWQAIKLFIFMTHLHRKDPFPLSYENILAGTVDQDADTVVRCPEIIAPTPLTGSGTAQLWHQNS